MRRRLAGLFVIALIALAALPTAGIQAAVLPKASLGDLVVTEPSGRSGTASVALVIVLSTPPTSPVVVGWRTVAGSAGAADFVADSGSLTINAGSQGGGISLGIRADRATEPAESFTVELTSASGATITDGIGRIDIRDASTGLAVSDVTVLEPDAGGVDVAVSVTVPSAPSKPVTFAWQLRAGTASIGSDVVAASGSGVIPKGALSAILFVRVLGDTTVEPAESLEVVVDSVKNVALADGIGAVTILNDDVIPPTPSPTPTATASPTPTPSPVPTLPPGLADWQPPAGSIPATGTVVYLASATGDYIGQGRTYAYTPANAIVAFDPAGDRFSVHVRGDETWDGWFAPQAAGVPLTTGSWTGLRRYPFNIPGLSWSGDGRGCNNLLGSLIIDELVQQGGQVVRLTARFEQKCDNSPGNLRGYLRYDSADTTTPPPPGDVADFPWSPPAGAVPETGDYLYYESSPGDYIGQGQTRLYTASNATITGSESSGVVRLRVTQVPWDVFATGPDAQTLLLPGLYDELGRHPFHNPTEGGLSMYGDGRGCNELEGAFAVDEIGYDAQGIVSFSIRFVQRCEITGPPLYGAMRWTRPGG